MPYITSFLPAFAKIYTHVDASCLSALVSAGARLGETRHKKLSGDDSNSPLALSFFVSYSILHAVNITTLFIVVV